MVDYLQNVCLHRYEKAYQKELGERAISNERADMTADAQMEEDILEPEEEFEEADMETGRTQAEVMQAKVTQAEVLPEKVMREEPAPVKKRFAEPELHIVPERDHEKDHEKESLEGTQQQFVEKEIRIRQILEEFMA